MWHVLLILDDIHSDIADAWYHACLNTLPMYFLVVHQASLIHPYCKLEYLRYTCGLPSDEGYHLRNWL